MRANFILIHLYHLSFMLLITPAVHRPNTPCLSSSHGLLIGDRNLNSASQVAVSVEGTSPVWKPSAQTDKRGIFVVK